MSGSRCPATRRHSANQRNMSHVREDRHAPASGGEMAIDWINRRFQHAHHQKAFTGAKMYETWYKMTVMLESGLDIRPVITHRLPYTGFQEGFDAMLSGNPARWC